MHARANLIHKCFVAKDVNTLLRALICHVCEAKCRVCILCVVTLQPYSSKEIEAVQRRFTKRLPRLNKLSYQERLSSLRLDSLEIRRIKADLLYSLHIKFCLVMLILIKMHFLNW